MQRHLQKWMLLLFVMFSSTMFAQTNVLTPTKGILRVKLQQEVATQIGIAPMSTRNGIVTTGITPFDRASQRVKAVKMERVFSYPKSFEAKARKHGLDLWYEIRFDEKVDPREAVQIYSKIPGVMIAENIVPMQLQEGNGKFVALTSSQVKAMSSNRAAAGMPFNDPLLNKQWHYHNDGSMNGSVAGADINLFKAWSESQTTGSKDLVVAIIDGGIDYKHIDLAENVAVNKAELNGKPGVDDDGNGYVDDIYGFNFVTNSGEIYPHDHGTHVAGTVAAVNNNGIGVSGVAGGNGQGGVKMISCQVFDPRSANADVSFAKAFVYAAVRGATLAQCSWGWGSPDYKEQAVLDAIDFFTEEAENGFMKGGLCIFANGNTGDEGDYYPSSYEPVVAVGAMTYDKKPASYSTYGNWVDITAPGGLLDMAVEQGVLSTLPSDNYGYNEGTSMACPHVSGVAALVLSKYGNPNFPSETLRQQLLTSVNDFYATNPGVAGKFGSGYIDANKALKMGGGNPPSTVGEFTLLPSQDNVLVQWNIPASEDNNVNYHTIYYSKQAFTASSDLSKLSQKKVDTKFYNSGDPVSVELTGLSPLTTYYVALQAVNRWGNAAPLSAVKTAMTNAGPKMELDKTNLSLTINTVESMTASDQFVISNTDKGLLKWKSYSRTVSVRPASVAKAVPGNLTPNNGKISAMPFRANTVVSADYEVEDYPVNFNYHSSLGAYIGESDMELSNSGAQWFYVNPEELPNGFNLTALKFEGLYGTSPIIEIYDGSGTINKGKLLQRITPTSFGYNIDQELTEQLYFAPGESFWVVIHFKKGNKTPLGMGIAKHADYKSYSFFSSNWGESWTQLSEVIREGNLADMADEAVWAVTARSKNPDWSSVMTLSPSEGMVNAGEKQEVILSNDGQRLVNGSYKFNLKLTTNESTNTEKNIPVAFTVKGNKPILQTAKVVNFGDLLLGQSKKLSVEIVNKGYGKFSGASGFLNDKNISTSSDQFIVPTYVGGGFSARATSTIDITFKPTKAGSHSGTITLKDAEGITHTFIVRGIADEPAKIAIAPNSFDLEDLEVGGAAKEAKFTITNEGKYPLEFVFPKFSDETITNQGKSSHKFGYSYVSNLNGATDFEYDGNPELVNATDITKQFNDNDIWSKPISLGFSFPYYGKMYDQIYVTSYGALAISIDGFIHQCSVPSASASCINGLGLISLYGANQLDMGANSKVEYAKQDGKFIVKFTNVMALVYDKEYTPVSFHIALSSNGDVECYYDDYTPYMLFGQGDGLFVGLNDIHVEDPITLTDVDTESEIYSSFTSGSAVKFIAPGKSMVQKLSTTNGVIAIGESQEITATLAAIEGMYAGALTNDLVIESNDPVKGVTYVNLKANIIGDALKPVAQLEKEAIDFGRVFKTAVVKSPLVVKNTGTNNLVITQVSLENQAFEFTQELPLTLAPGNSKDIMITLPTVAEGKVADVITITTADGATLEATLAGEVIGVPEIKFDMSEITETTPSGTNVMKQIVVENKGNQTLEYSIVPNSFINLPDKEIDENSSVDYVYSSSMDNEDVQFVWEDIETNGKGTHRKLTYYMNKDYETVELPYDLTFYGKKYNKIHIYAVGFISFNEREDLKEFPGPPATLPSTATLYNNIIAPYWGLHMMDQTSTAGTFYCVEEDRVIVSFMEYGNSMNYGICFQVIINRDGSFKYQYKFADAGGDLQYIYGVAGIQNNGATEGINLPARYVYPGKAVEFYTVKTDKIAPGANKTLDVEILADKLAGTYETGITMSTNVPTVPTVTLPVHLTITGEPKPVYPEKVSMESVMGVTGLQGALEIPFEIANEGTAAFTIKDIAAEGLIGYEGVGQLWYYGKHVDDWTEQEFFGYGVYMPGTELTVGKEPLKFKVMFMNVYEIADYAIPMSFAVEGLDKETIDIPFELSITPVPVIGFNKEEIRVSNVSDEYTGEEEMKILNNGEYKLTYSLTFDPTGVGEVMEEGDGGGGVSLATVKMKTLSVEERAELAKTLVKTQTPVKKASAKEINMDIPSEGEYNRALYYPMQPGNKNLFLFGAADKYSEFKAATHFTAPVEGFNISHLYFYFTIGDLKNVDIRAEIIQGGDITKGTVIGKGTLHVEKEDPIGVDQGGAPVYNGQFGTMVLDKPVFINPNEQFYVCFTFPIGYDASVGLVNKEEAVVGNRYICWKKSYGWLDLAAEFETTYGSLGYFTTCLETEAGSSWAKLLTSTTSGEIAPSEFVSVKVSLDASLARIDKDNKAVLVIRSNDPEQPLVNYPIYLDKNVAPVITSPASTPYVKEAAISVIGVDVMDQEGESFTVKVKDEEGIAKLQDYVINPDANVEVTKVDDNTIKVTVLEGAATEDAAIQIKVALSPKYGQAGAHSFEVTAADASENAASKVVKYFVEHVNRAPIAQECEALEIGVGSTTSVIEYASLFKDPDGDAMTYAMKLSSTGIVNAFQASEGVILSGVKLGKVEITVTATDAVGAFAENTFEVKVTDGTGIDEVELKEAISVYPNPVVDKANVTCNVDAEGEISYKLYNANGTLLYNASAAKARGEAYTIDMESFATGVYYLELNVDGTKTTVPVMKK